MSSENRVGPRARVLVATVALVAITVLVIGSLMFLGHVGSDPEAASGPSEGTTSTPPATPSPSTPTSTTPDASTKRPRERGKRPVLPTIGQGLANRVERISRRAPDAPERIERVPDLPTIFGVSSFNVLGASHTSGPRGRKGFAPGAPRMVRATTVLRNSGVDVVGLQEFEPSQYAVLRARMPAFEVFPSSTGPGVDRANAIAWDATVWDVVRTAGIAIPYFGGRDKLMPYVLLANKATGKEIWFANFHNPANVAGPAAGLRLEALRREARLAVELSADGTPVVMTGDMNDRAPFACPFTRASGMVSANGAYSDGSGCHLPKGMNVDWILGTPDLEFSNFWANFATKTGRISDHPMISATLTLPGDDAR